MTVDDPSFLQRLRRRDETAFSLLVREYQDRVFRLVFRMLGDRAEAEDLAQEVFVTVFKSIDSFRGESRLSTWIYRIATNQCRNRIKYLARRHHQRQEPIEEETESRFAKPFSEPSPRPDAQLEGAELERILQEALGALDEDHRAVIILREIDQLAYEEIAQILDVAVGTVKSRLFRGRTELQERIRARYRR